MGRRIMAERIDVETVAAELRALQGRIKEAERQKARLEGRLQELTERLRKEFGVESADAGRALLDKLRAVELELSERLAESVARLKELEKR